MMYDAGETGNISFKYDNEGSRAVIGIYNDRIIVDPTSE